MDVSGSMSAYLDRLRQQIHQYFSGAVQQEEYGYSLSHGNGSMAKISYLINQGCDAIFWFCDLQDNRDFEAVSQVEILLKQNKAKFYVRSLDQTADVHLLSVINSSGGEFKTGNINDDLVSH